MAIVGKILLGILLFILILLLLVLFLPICYRIKAKFNAEGKSLNAKAFWFFGFIRFTFDLPEPARPILKLAFCTLIGKEDSETKEKNQVSENIETPESVPGNPEEAKDDTDHPEKSEEKPFIYEEPINSEEPVNSVELSAASDTVPQESDVLENSYSEHHIDENKDNENNEIKKTANERNSNKRQYSEKPHKSLKIFEILDDVKYYKALWEENDTQPFVKDTFTRVLHILKNLLPQKIRGKILFGAESPDITGYVYGAYSVLKTMYPKRFSLEFSPDFERKVLEVDILAKGRFMVITLLFDMLRILLDKRFKELRRKIDLRKHPEKAKEQDRSPKGKRKRKPKKIKKEVKKSA